MSVSENDDMEDEMSVKRNCHTCGWDRVVASRYRACDSPDYSGATDYDAYVAVADWIDGNVTEPDSMPSEDADGCPGWKPKPGADNTDRARVAALSGSATIRPDSATATVKHPLTVGGGWRGHKPICRGPGGTVARRLRRLARGRR